MYGSSEAPPPKTSNWYPGYLTHFIFDVELGTGCAAVRVVFF